MGDRVTVVQYMSTRCCWWPGVLICTPVGAFCPRPGYYTPRWKRSALSKACHLPITPAAANILTSCSCLRTLSHSLLAACNRQSLVWTIKNFITEWRQSRCWSTPDAAVCVLSTWTQCVLLHCVSEAQSSSQDKTEVQQRWLPENIPEKVQKSGS